MDPNTALSDSTQQPSYTQVQPRQGAYLRECIEAFLTGVEILLVVVEPHVDHLSPVLSPNRLGRKVLCNPGQTCVN